MDELFGLLIFGIIAVISMVAKVAEKRKADQQRQARGERRVRREDLPEATRRMLYGDGDGPRTATPRAGEPPVMSRPTAEPGAARPAAVPPPPPQSVRRSAAPVPDVRRQREQRMAEAPQRVHGGRTAQPQAPAQRPPRGTIEPRMAAPQSLRETYRETHPRREQAAAPPKQQRRQQPAPQRPAPRPHPARRKRKPALAMFLTTSESVRHGIVMAEILGRPKGLQDS